MNKTVRQSEGEELLMRQVLAARLPEPEREYRFCPDRRWRSDFCWPCIGLIVEIEGGVWRNGRHTRGSGFVADIEKYNMAALLGFKVLRFTTDMVKDGSAIEVLKEILQ